MVKVLILYQICPVKMTLTTLIFSILFFHLFSIFRHRVTTAILFGSKTLLRASSPHWDCIKENSAIDIKQVRVQFNVSYLFFISIRKGVNLTKISTIQYLLQHIYVSNKNTSYWFKTTRDTSFQTFCCTFENEVRGPFLFSGFRTGNRVLS